MPHCADRPPPRRLPTRLLGGPVALLASAALAGVGCADDAATDTATGTGGAGATATATTGSTGGPGSSGSGQSGTASGGGDGGGGPGTSSSSGGGDAPTSTSSSSGGGDGGAGQGGTGQGGTGQGGSGGSGQGGAGQGGSGGAGQGGAGQGGSGGSGQGGAGQGGAGQGGGGGVAPCADDLDCDDGIACTTDTCDLGTGLCSYQTDDAVCDDGLSCTGVEVCTLDGCEDGTPLDCDDGVACTADFCDPDVDGCANVPQDLACTDGAFCNGVEVCDVVLGCQPGTPPDCDDGVACTEDACDEGADACAFVPNHGACADADLCDGAELCDPQMGCVEGAPLVCDDGIACTIDLCEPATGCDVVPNDAACDDGSDCNGIDFCDAQLGCQDGTPVVCGDDGIACTVEVCDEQTLLCSSVPDNDLCPNGQFCVPQQDGCVAGVPCVDDAACDDGNPCNGDETCPAGTCVPGEEVVCDDGIDCTFEQCDPGTGLCEVFPQDEDCEDGNACNGIATCEVGVGCVAGTPVDCSDGVACTVDLCNPATGTCSNPPNHGACSDGEPCNGAEQCTQNGCQPGAPLVCPGDGVACTTEACVPGVGCRSTPDDSLCPCGQTCGAQGCGNFCVVRECQGKVYQCGDCVDNDGDCRIDSGDSQCLGPCDNTENSFYGGIPGQNNSPCKSDCYFDQDTGAGNDDCFWSHKCDPLEVPPDYPPEGSQCAYDPGANIPGYGGTCATAFASQSATCGSYCGPLVPNGCDCFGCCEIPGAPTTVWLGSEVNNQGSCNINTLNDPSRCKPCTQVPACLNTCEECELCIGKPELPEGCEEQECPAGAQLCGQPGQNPCPADQYCVTGCCQDTPQ